MAGLMNSGAAETMQEAYDRAVYADPTIRQAILAEEATKAEAKRKEEEAKRVQAAKKAAGVNVKSSPGQANAPRTMDDELREIARKHYGTH
jgi:septal ring-binding cell division protein DamX